MGDRGRRVRRALRLRRAVPGDRAGRGAARRDRRPARAAPLHAGRRRPWRRHDAAHGAGADRRRHAAAGARALHARRGWRAWSASALALWAGAMALLAARFGIDGLLTQMGWFFTKAALLTFGGAYAVLPYVYQGAVEHHGWLTGPQMIAGLALGETTPGPLIMVVAFVGFVGGWQAPLFGAESMLCSAACSRRAWSPSSPSCRASCSSLPARRWSSRRHGNLRFTAPLTAITAAVVGVIVNLALFFARHVFWPQGMAGAIDWPALAIAGAARAGAVPLQARRDPGDRRLRAGRAGVAPGPT
ncbi:MAG: chromate transporter [Candidatus Moduliflexus flocculans]|nr:chromate transporter [Candidatus Moduliflexus flocculans]